MITEARRRIAGQDLPVTFDVGDAHQLAFADGAFDISRTERMLRYVASLGIIVTGRVSHASYS
jgi:ubiquinone/menaquinone biosynthesis C-methylase UbiE